MALDRFDDVHPLDDLAEDDVLAVSQLVTTVVMKNWLPVRAGFAIDSAGSVCLAQVSSANFSPRCCCRGRRRA